MGCLAPATLVRNIWVHRHGVASLHCLFHGWHHLSLGRYRLRISRSAAQPYLCCAAPPDVQLPVHVLVDRSAALFGYERRCVCGRCRALRDCLPGRGKTVAGVIVRHSAS